MKWRNAQTHFIWDMLANNVSFNVWLKDCGVNNGHAYLNAHRIRNWVKANIKGVATLSVYWPQIVIKALILRETTINGQPESLFESSNELSEAKIDAFIKLTDKLKTETHNLCRLANMLGASDKTIKKVLLLKTTNNNDVVFNSTKEEYKIPAAFTVDVAYKSSEECRGLFGTKANMVILDETFEDKQWPIETLKNLDKRRPAYDFAKQTSERRQWRQGSNEKLEAANNMLSALRYIHPTTIGRYNMNKIQYNKSNLKKHFTFAGRNIDDMTDAEIINIIHTLENDITGYKRMASAEKSKKIQKFIKNAEKDLASLVAHFDKRK